MMNLNMGEAYNQAEQETESYGPMPNAYYPVIIESSEFAQFRSGKWGVKLMYSVYGDSTFDNRKLFDNFVLFEQDQQTEVTYTDDKGNTKNIGKLKYASVCSAAGLTPEQASDPTNLLQKTLVIKTKQQNKNDGSGDKESVPSVYKPVAQPGGMQQQAQQQTQQGQGSIGFHGRQEQQQTQQGQGFNQGNAFQR